MLSVQVARRICSRLSSLSLLILLAGCATFTPYSLNYLSLGMSKSQVLSTIGQPNFVPGAIQTTDGKSIETWQYDTYDLLGNRVDSYCLHFVNGQLQQWRQNNLWLFSQCLGPTILAATPGSAPSVSTEASQVRFCPVGGELYSTDVKFCPNHGIELRATASGGLPSTTTLALPEIPTLFPDGRSTPKTGYDPSLLFLDNASSDDKISVQGYYRKDGTYVRPHTRSRPRR